MRVLCIGDVVGDVGRAMVAAHLAHLVKKYDIDAIIVNGENSAYEGRGITPSGADFFKSLGVHVITTGNHIWARREIYQYLQDNHFLLRPANFPNGVPGVGMTTVTIGSQIIGVINLQGRVFMRENLDCPFKVAESLLTYLRHKTHIILVDFHAETTSEKMALGYFLDGKVSAVFGTHTHVQTADERILPQGTAFITDLGMVGARNSLLGMKKDPIITMFLTQMPTKFAVETEPPYILNGIVVTVDDSTGKATHIERVFVQDNQKRG
jgi:metallophosphoesterase (TIGR00282 family)